MKGKGIDNTLKFILKENTPILEIKNSVVEESENKLLLGTVVEGMLKTRVVKVGREKEGYLAPSSVNVYIDKFANLDGEELKDTDLDLKETVLGEKPQPKSKVKNFIINWGLPITGGFIGYKIAKKMDSDDKKTFGFVVFFGLLGMIPRFMSKK